MTKPQLPTTRHQLVRRRLRWAGPLTLAVGLGFAIVGLVSFFSAFGSFESPRYFWCLFVAFPLIGVGLVMCKLAFLGAELRYLFEETAPVAKDMVNYLGESTQPGVRAAAQAIAEGVKEGLREDVSR